MPKPFILPLLTAALLIGAAAAQGGEQAQAGAVVFEDVLVFDGAELTGPTTVVISDGVIAAVGDDAERPEGAEVVAGDGLTLMPGLIDAHVHTFTPQMLTAGRATPPPT